MFMLNHDQLDMLAELAGIFADTDGKYYKKFISYNIFTNEYEEEYLPVSKFVVKEELEHLLDEDPSAAGEVGLTRDEALGLLECFAAAIEG